MPTRDLSDQLSSELWAQILSQLAAVLTKEFLEAKEEGVCEGAARQNLLQIDQLLLVCKKFTRAYAEHKHLSGHLYLDAQLTYSSLPSLLRWIYQSGGGVRILICDSHPYEGNADLAVAALSYTAAASLTTAMTFSITRDSMGLLSTFTRLTRCDLNGEDADLVPLHVLHNLDCLNLTHGTYMNIQGLSGLTRLYVCAGNVQASGECSFGRSLKELHAEGSDIDLHNQGLSICTVLASLACSHSNIISSVSQGSAHSVFSCLEYGPVSGLPSDILDLTDLTTVDVDLRDFDILPAADCVNLEWVGALVNLQNFCFKACDVAEVRFGRQWGKLQKLQKLWVQNLEEHVLEPEPGSLCSSIPWERLQALESVYLGGKATFGPGVFALTGLTRLYSLTMCMPASISSALVLGAFMHMIVLQQQGLAIILMLTIHRRRCCQH